MIKHICDKCGKEVSDSVPAMWHIHCEARDTTGTYFDFDICSECMLEIAILLDKWSDNDWIKR